MEAYERERLPEQDRFDHKPKKEKGHKPTKKQRSKYADEEDDWTPMQRD